jgi:hypothetical protein
MVPQDQQVDVAPPGMINDELALGTGFVINKFTTNACPAPYVHTVQGGAPWCKDRECAS